jgi:hypothetical protein
VKVGRLLMGACFLIFALATARRAQAAPPTNACSLLTTVQINAALGASTGASRSLTSKLCQWGSPDIAGKKLGVMLTLQDTRAFAYAKMPVGNGITKVPVSGIGDDAVYGKSPGYATVLSVKKGDMVFTVHVSGFPDEQIKAKEKALALDVVAKL